MNKEGLKENESIHTVYVTGLYQYIMNPAYAQGVEHNIFQQFYIFH